MISPTLAHVLIPAIVAVSIVLMLARPRNIPEVYWISGGVLSLLLLRLISFPLAGHALLKAVDVCLFLIGMMLLSELGREHGLFDWLSAIAVRNARGSCVRLFSLVYIVGTVVTIFLSNDATAVVLTPAILTAVRKARVQPLPYLFVCAFIANAASFVLPISNPANLVVFHGAMPPLTKWLAAFCIPSVLSILTTYIVLRWMFSQELRATVGHELELHRLNGNGKIVLGSLGVMVAVLLIASAFGKDLGLPTCLVAVVITTVVCMKEKNNPVPLLREISWETLALVGGLFILVDATESIGAMRYTQQWLTWVQHTSTVTADLITGFAVGIANNLVNNLPLGLIAGSTLESAHATGSIAYAVMIGVDLGPNLSITGSLATILWLIALRKEKLDVGFWTFLKIGAVAMPAALLAALAGSILMRYV